jgi:hypothetical protein
MTTEAQTAPEMLTGSRLSPAFRVELRRRYDETAPLEHVVVHARTIASARHAVKLAHPDTVIVSIAKAE